MFGILAGMVVRVPRAGFRKLVRLSSKSSAPYVVRTAQSAAGPPS
jgi:hypothetical protein